MAQEDCTVEARPLAGENALDKQRVTCLLQNQELRRLFKFFLAIIWATTASMFSACNSFPHWEIG